MPYYEDEVFRYFEREINESGNKKIEKLGREIELIKDKQLNRIDEEIHDSVFKAMEIELNEMSLDYSAQLNRIKLSTHQKLIMKKRELMDSVLFEVQNKLKSFIKTVMYRDRMKLMIKKIDERFCGKNMLFRIKKKDIVMKEIIANNFTNTYEIEEVNTIVLGGFIAVCQEKGILTDQTVDTKLEEKRIWFNQKMKFAIKER